MHLESKNRMKLQFLIPYIDWTRAVIAVFFSGVSPCLTAFLDIFDILNVLSFFKSYYISYFVAIIKAGITLAISIFDIHYCKQSLDDGN